MELTVSIQLPAMSAIAKNFASTPSLPQILTAVPGDLFTVLMSGAGEGKTGTITRATGAHGQTKYFA
ncbi:hypothetical protein GRI44_02650 [Altererythrobacter confluentis]|uniref:Uncharacterized protein n=1 Tax=Allopontixanthobacter confluentis TaxID=1849021 RepID=A0A6L7GCG3_9SPHN|nr:hypothetical protein [Allopontixanthobacter confluentis]MXP13653.1 hypothetical protein [Allopontixanthobacter confluentis]